MNIVYATFGVVFASLIFFTISKGVSFSIKLGIFFLFVIPEYMALRIGSFPELVVLRLYILTMFGILLIREVYPKNNHPLVINKSMLQYVLIVSPFLIWRLLSAYFACDQWSNIAVFGAVNDIVIFLGLATLVYFSIEDVEDVSALFEVIVLAAFVVNTYAIFESCIGYNPIQDIIPISGREFAFSSKYRGDYYRVSSVFVHPIALAFFSMIAVTSAFFVKSLSTSSVPRYLSLYVIVTAPIICFLADARGALFLLCIAYILVFFSSAPDLFKSKSPLKKLFFVSLIFAIATLVPIVLDYFLERFFNASGYALESNHLRMMQIKNGLEAMADKWFLGFGPQSAGDTIAVRRGGIDNYYIGLGVESGVVGLLLFVFFIAMTMRSLFKVYIQSKEYFIPVVLPFILLVIYLFISSLRFPLYLLAIYSGIVVALLSQKICGVIEDEKS